MSDKDIDLGSGAEAAGHPDSEKELAQNTNSSQNDENTAAPESVSSVPEAESAHKADETNTIDKENGLPSQDDVNKILLGKDRPEKEVRAFTGQQASPAKKVLTVACLILVVALAGASAYFYFGVMKSDSFVKGTSIGGINVSGMNQDEAVKAVDAVLKNRLNDEVVFYKGSYTDKDKLSKLIDSVDTKKAVADAFEAEKARDWKAFYDSITGAVTVNHSLGITMRKSAEEDLVKAWDKKWSEPAVDARLDLDESGDLVIMPEKAGKKVDSVATFEQLKDAMSGTEKLRIEILVIDEVPKVTEKDLEGMHELADYTSEYDTGLENRSHNLELAAGKIDNTKLEPGEVFSFNDTVGERTVAAGYLDALIFVGNQVEPGLGGGVCQVASTLYNTVLLSGLEIVERHNHNLPITYVPLGRDATVNWGSMDFQFKNNSDSTIYIAARAGGGTITISIFGKGAVPNVEVKSQVEGSIGFATVEKLDPTMPAGTRRVDSNGAEGYYASAWRIFYDDKGKEIETETLSHDSYNGKDAVIFVGPPLGTPGTPGTVPGSPSTNPNSTSNPNSSVVTTNTGTNSSTETDGVNSTP